MIKVTEDEGAAPYAEEIVFGPSSKIDTSFQGKGMNFKFKKKK